MQRYSIKTRQFNSKMRALISKLKTMIHTYYPEAMSLPTINFLHFTVSEILPGQYFIGQGHYGKVKDQIKVTP